jgi:hypothetical protein
MSPRRYLGVATALGGAGALFAGYLSYTRASSGMCAFAEPCPFFLGQPACYTGFALFSAAFLVSLTALVRRVETVWPVVTNLAIALAGTVFAGWLTGDELAAHSGYRLGLPTCAYGLVFFFALLSWSIAAAMAHPRVVGAWPAQRAHRRS